MGKLIQTAIEQKQFYIDKLMKAREINASQFHHWTVAELRRKYEQYEERAYGKESN
ncbi:hypothetical protein [Anoxybacillus sp. TBDG-1]